ncbi:ABC transporter permease [Limnochorda pilosa]|uniref:Membrane protein n=1 Tax=Limnochorda pilosa TaxID=1555112 RepID=A0A0K2SI11_LIMPI|nr:ABC transporter permease subunit [Limnochorda pilosa]BAS26720.1 membrane protein [Limnochorda pilosa]
MNLGALLRKEWLDALRTHKLLFLLLALVFFGVSQPLATHFMPQILQMSGLPEGAVIEIPPLPPPAILGQVFDQYRQLGVLFIILAAMGAVSREIELGQAAVVLTLGYSRARYLLAKWAVLGLVVVGSVVLGTVAAAYYTQMLFGPLAWGAVLVAALSFSLYGLFILGSTLVFSSLLSSQMGVVAASIAVPMGLSLVPLFRRALAGWLPVHVADLAKVALAQPVPGLWRAALVTVAWTGLALFLAHAALRRREV